MGLIFNRDCNYCGKCCECISWKKFWDKEEKRIKQNGIDAFNRYKESVELVKSAGMSLENHHKEYCNTCIHSIDCLYKTQIEAMITSGSDVKLSKCTEYEVINEHSG